MDGKPAQYLGRLVSKEHFRAFVYSPIYPKKVANSWDEFEKLMATGLWFATPEEAIPPPAAVDEIELPKPKKQKVKNDAVLKVSERDLSDTESFKVKTDDFLSDAS